MLDIEPAQVGLPGTVRRMVLWHVTSYRDGLALEYQRLLAVSHLQQDYGRWQWRWHAPLRDRLALRLTQLDVTAEIVRSTAEEPHNSALVPDTSGTLNPQPSKSTVLLIEATAAILANAERDGVDISQAALARQLRERGYRVGNDPAPVVDHERPHHARYEHRRHRGSLRSQAGGNDHISRQEIRGT